MSVHSKPQDCLRALCGIAHSPETYQSPDGRAFLASLFEALTNEQLRDYGLSRLPSHQLPPLCDLERSLASTQQPADHQTLSVRVPYETILPCKTWSSGDRISLQQHNLGPRVPLDLNSDSQLRAITSSPLSQSSASIGTASNLINGCQLDSTKKRRSNPVSLINNKRQKISDGANTGHSKRQTAGGTVPSQEHSVPAILEQSRACGTNIPTFEECFRANRRYNYLQKAYTTFLPETELISEECLELAWKSTELTPKQHSSGHKARLCQIAQVWKQLGAKKHTIAIERRIWYLMLMHEMEVVKNYHASSRKIQLPHGVTLQSYIKEKVGNEWGIESIGYCLDIAKKYYVLLSLGPAWIAEVNTKGKTAWRLLTDEDAKDLCEYRRAVLDEAQKVDGEEGKRRHRSFLASKAIIRGLILVGWSYEELAEAKSFLMDALKDHVDLASLRSGRVQSYEDAHRSSLAEDCRAPTDGSGHSIESVTYETAPAMARRIDDELGLFCTPPPTNPTCNPGSLNESGHEDEPSAQQPADWQGSGSEQVGECRVSNDKSIEVGPLPVEQAEIEFQNCKDDDWYSWIRWDRTS